MRKGKEEETKPGQPIFCGFSRWRVNPRAASGGGAWMKHAAAVFCPRSIPVLFPCTVLQLLEALGCFRDFFFVCNFKLVDVIFCVVLNFYLYVVNVNVK